MVYLFNKILFQPLFNILVLIYQFLAFRDFGVAIILFTFFVRLLLSPFFHASLKQQKIMAGLQPEIKKIQKEHKDREKQTRALLDLYQKNKANPFSSLLFLIVQLPILIALYQVLWVGLNGGRTLELYSFVADPGAINYSFLGLINLREASILMVGLAALVQYFQAKLSLPASGEASKGRSESDRGLSQAKAGQTMVLVGPIVTFLVLWKLPAAIGLYWLSSSLFSLGQQILVNRKFNAEPKINN
jgi:YidC/Oxa1 family membrane protein insertase